MISFIKKAIIEKVILALLDKFTAACNGLTAIIGMLLVVAAPLAGATIPIFSHFTPIAVLIATAGSVAGTIICMSSYAKIKDRIIIKTQKELLEAKETSEAEIGQLKRDLDSERSENNTLRSKIRERHNNIINAFELSPINISLKHKIEYDVFNYHRFDMKGLSFRSKVYETISSKNKARKEFIGILHSTGTLYLGTDWDKIKVEIDTENKKVRICGSLNNFQLDTAKKDWEFAQIQETKYKSDSDIDAKIESKPTDISIIDSDPHSSDLDICKQKAEKDIPSIEKSLCLNALTDELEENTKKYVRTILKPACSILNYEIEFADAGNEDSTNTMNLTNAIYALNSYTRKYLENPTNEF